ncbi:MAG: ribose transport system permease protein [Verrucomicrobiota bacterium]|nr:ribose transport system permease protein [Verrucomicrobiota bacterium]MDK2962946.1 ribose transport system permease protein [Verrucomicrobiota bacterium]
MRTSELSSRPGFTQTTIGRTVGRNWALFFLIFMVIVFAFTGSGFFEIANFQNIIHLSSTSILLAAAETFVIITGGIDLSVGFVMGLSSALAARIMVILSTTALPVPWIIILGSLAGLVISLIPGFISGTLVARFKVPPFIATMGMWGICNGITLRLCHGFFPIAGLPAALPELGNGYLIYIHPGKSITFFQKPEYLADNQIRELIRLIPFSFILITVVILILWFILHRHRFGQHTYAIGDNVDAAIRAGIDVNRHLVKIYMLSSFLAGLAGVYNVFQTGIGNYTTFSAMYELFAVAAVVIGGASLAGGKGRILGSFVGVLVLAVLKNGLAISGVEPFVRYIAVGVLLIVAVTIDQLFPDLF